MNCDGALIAAGSITADKISAGGMKVEPNRIVVRDQHGNVRVQIGNLDIEPVARTQDEIEQWGPNGLIMRERGNLATAWTDPHEPPKTDVPITTAEEVW